MRNKYKTSYTLKDICKKQYELHQYLRDIMYWKRMFTNICIMVGVLVAIVYVCFYWMFWQSSILVAFTTSVLVRMYYIADTQYQEELIRDCLAQLKTIRNFLEHDVLQPSLQQEETQEEIHEDIDHHVERMIQNYYDACDTYRLILQLRN